MRGGTMAIGGGGGGVLTKIKAGLAKVKAILVGGVKWTSWIFAVYAGCAIALTPIGAGIQAAGRFVNGVLAWALEFVLGLFGVSVTIPDSVVPILAGLAGLTLFIWDVLDLVPDRTANAVTMVFPSLLMASGAGWVHDKTLAVVKHFADSALGGLRDAFGQGSTMVFAAIMLAALSVLLTWAGKKAAGGSRGGDF